MKETWIKRGVLLGIACVAGCLCFTESSGRTNFLNKNYGVVLDSSLEARSGLPTKEERIYGVSQIWKMAADHYAGWDLTDEDMSWDEAYQIACEEAGNAKTSYEYYLALRKFLANLNHGISDEVYGPSVTYGWGVFPIFIGYVEDQWVVGSTKDEEKYPIGTVVEQINGMEPGEYLEKTFGEYVGTKTPGVRENLLAEMMLYGEAGEELAIELRKPGTNEIVSVVETWTMDNRFKPQQWTYSSVSIDSTELYTSDYFQVNELTEEICCFTLKSEKEWSCLDEYYEKVVPILAGYEGVVLDWRNDRGGDSMIGDNMVGQMILENFLEEGTPIVMVIWRKTEGSGEAVVAEAKRAGVPLVGTRTKGAVGDAMEIDLGGGWKTYISTEKYLTSEGVDLTNHGIEPDVYVDFTIEDLMNGHDAQMERAVQVLRGEIDGK